jgi:hypothetical protein
MDKRKKERPHAASAKATNKLDERRYRLSLWPGKKEIVRRLNQVPHEKRLAAIDRLLPFTHFVSLMATIEVDSQLGRITKPDPWYYTRSYYEGVAKNKSDLADPVAWVESLLQTVVRVFETVGAHDDRDVAIFIHENLPDIPDEVNPLPRRSIPELEVQQPRKTSPLDEKLNTIFSRKSGKESSLDLDRIERSIRQQDTHPPSGERKNKRSLP